ncbi:MAG: Polyketide cyclase/dehydrase [Planctomycetaceae bacterium]|nr:Polyketide cyclase/dehydrase [Planctomycetaceae bacterium]
MAVFETSVILDCSVERVFAFMISPANHEKLSPPDVGLKFVNPPAQVELGSQFEFKMQAWGSVQTARHEVIQFDSPNLYIERAIRSPMKSYLHEHRFEIDGNGKTVMTDRIEFLPPGGILGLLVTESKILDSLEDGFYFRHQQLKNLLKGTD